MSRWIDQFNSHPFQTIWLQLKDELHATKVDDETILTDVNELARLKKVVGYIDGMIQSIDPELVPVGTWDSFRDQATNCNQQIASFNSNRNIGHITNANSHAENLLTYIRPYMVVNGKIGIALQKAIKGYADTIDEYGNSFRDKSHELLCEIKRLKEESEGSSQALNGIKQTVDEFYVELFGPDFNSGIQSKIRTLISDFETKYGTINSYYNETLIGDENNLSTKKEILIAKEGVIADQKSIKDILKSVEDKITELNDFHTTIFGELAENNTRSGGLSGEFDARLKALKKFEDDQKIKYKALNEEIETLLPGATSAGLATAYSEMKATFDAPIKNSTRLFYGSIGLLIAGTIFFSIEKVIWDSGITFVNPSDWDTILKSLVNKLPFYAPVLWLAFYATKRRSEFHRLQQEYAHKEAFAKSYKNYKQQLQDLEGSDTDLQTELIKKAIDAIAYNASQTLDKKHGDKMPIQEIIEKTVDKSISTISSIKKGESP
ncbi:hypothetical protein A1353_14335 [Methylomonas methanica]|uniref:Uncharacterized protein n=1 Tax=Methylomonas methanica TaxID=421 RepID=A0A177MDL9_METMH|nr:hypothetical protein [Methylomonas methanica]OAI03721.1 hypothetical protein A1353_14335 [Methylomonas methanica]